MPILHIHFVVLILQLVARNVIHFLHSIFVQSLPSAFSVFSHALFRLFFNFYFIPHFFMSSILVSLFYLICLVSLLFNILFSLVIHWFSFSLFSAFHYLIGLVFLLFNCFCPPQCPNFCSVFHWFSFSVLLVLLRFSVFQWLCFINSLISVFHYLIGLLSLLFSFVY